VRRLRAAMVASQVESRGGYLADLNGDGALALFRGLGGADRGLAAAAGICLSLAGPRRIRLPAGHGPVRAGIGIDQGEVYCARISGQSGPLHSWVGANTAAKLARLPQAACSMIMTREAFSDMTDARILSPAVRASEQALQVGGRSRVVRTLTLPAATTAAIAPCSA
jgi:class 3 adenylate cyclase